MFKIGCAEKVLEVPLFIELYGYAFFARRRNQGTCGDFYCRAFSFNDGENRAMIIYTDTCTTDDAYAREFRGKIASKFSIHPECIAFVATHTHSAPALFRTRPSLGSGIPDPDFQDQWKQAVMEVAEKAFYNEEEISYAEAGKTKLSRKLGENRVEVEKNITDETIRWVKFVRPDGTCKVLLHSHGVHGICTNGPRYKIASSDWPGSVNRMIQEEKLADMPLFLLGPCGDVNAAIDCTRNPGKHAADILGSLYIKDLKKSLKKGGEKITDLTISGAMETVRIPSVKHSIERLASDAEKLRAMDIYEAERASYIDEMIMLIKRGADLSVHHDFQVLKFGEISLLFIPGEYFVEDGAALMRRSKAKYPFAATVSNGNGAYYPSEKTMKRYPTVESKGEHCFGYYEIYGYPVGHRYKYADNVARFVADTLLKIEKKLK